MHQPFHYALSWVKVSINKLNWEEPLKQGMKITILFALSSMIAPAFTPAPDLFSSPQPPPVYQEQETAYIKSHWELIPQASVISPTTMKLIESDYQIPYSEVLRGFPAVHFTLASPFKRFGDMQTYGYVRAGYSYKSGNYRVPALSHDSKDASLSLLWVPLSVGTKVQYIIPGFPYVRPALHFGIGMQYLKQNSSFAELNSSTWLPYYAITPQIGFFEGAGDTWFNGFAFGISYLDSLGFNKKVRAWSYDLSLSIIL